MESKDFSPLEYRGVTYNHSSLKFHYEEWDEEKLKWRHKWTTQYLDGTKRDFFEYDNHRQDGVFMILDCLNVTNNNRLDEIHPHLNVYCNEYVDKYTPVEPSWTHGWINPIFEKGGFGERFGAGMDNPRHNFIFQDTHVVFDGRPNFYISYTNLVDFDKPIEHESKFLKAFAGYHPSDELEDLYIKQHPYFCARTLGELFKLIIDWDLAYHHFNNKENIAIICHKILGSIDMPIDVYNDLAYKMPDSVVSKYLKGHDNPTDIGERPKTPESAINWFREKYWDLRNTVDHSIHNTGDVVENHYFIRDFIVR